MNALVPASFRRQAGRMYAGFAFGRLAPLYRVLTAHEAWRRSCRELGALVPGPLVLDLGMGPGDGALEMARADPSRRHVGVDLSAAMVSRAARAAAAAGAALRPVRADGLALPVREGAFDGVTAHSYLYLVPDPLAALAEARRALRPGGRLALLEPREGPLDVRGALSCGARGAASMLLWRSMSRLHRRFTEDALATLLEAAGFGDVGVRPALAGFGVLATGARPAP
ncbi:MAG TPA: class I SAM-dependent methyltransferase [Anaeromyxobacteraceae bacterium]|nr:class I SAM-dependent methyltransferase [Anaeromyxobacteraceae bacterium]